jgi:predicted transcriptional regulator of viral defense system
VEEKSVAGRQILSAHPEVRLARIAARQHGIVSRRQLRAVGLDDAAIRRRVARGYLHRVHVGVYAFGNPQLTQHARWMAAVIACGQGSALSHLDAAVLLGFHGRLGPRIHVTVKWRRDAEGLILHRTRRLDPDEVTRKDGIPVTTVARTLVDLTELLNADRVLRAMREAEYQRLLDLNTLNAAVERAHGRKRLEALKNAIAQHRPGQIIRGELEHRFAELRRAGGLMAPETNVPLTIKGQTYVIDCLWRDEQIAVELDGRDAHERALAFESDRRRDAALTAIGLRPMRFTWQRVSYDGAEVLADLTAAMKRSSLSRSRS